MTGIEVPVPSIIPHSSDAAEVACDLLAETMRSLPSSRPMDRVLLGDLAAGIVVEIPEGMHRVQLSMYTKHLDVYEAFEGEETIKTAEESPFGLAHRWKDRRLPGLDVVLHGPFDESEES